MNRQPPRPELVQKILQGILHSDPRLLSGFLASPAGSHAPGPVPGQQGPNGGQATSTAWEVWNRLVLLQSYCN
jgi:hypothetical protein